MPLTMQQLKLSVLLKLDEYGTATLKHDTIAQTMGPGVDLAKAADKLCVDAPYTAVVDEFAGKITFTPKAPADRV